MYCGKGVLKNCTNFTGKHLCWSLLLINLQVFKKSYVEEHLRTTVCRKINICLIVKIILLRRIKILNSSVNKEKKHLRKFDVGSHVTQELWEIGASAMRI